VDEISFVQTVEDFLRPDLRHSHPSNEQTLQELPAYAAELYQLLLPSNPQKEPDFSKGIASLYTLYSSLERATIRTANTAYPPEQANFALYHSPEGLFSEAGCICEPVIPTVPYTFSLDLFSKDRLHLRIDPLDRPGLIEDLRISIRTERGDTFYTADLASMFEQTGTNHIHSCDCIYRATNTSRYLIASSYDPQIILPPLNHSGLCRLQISLRVKSFIPDVLLNLLTPALQSLSRQVGRAGRSPIPE
jgi:hypothetical protein